MMRVIFTLLAALVVPVIANAEVYKWVDENGRVHFGNHSRDVGSADHETVEIKDRFAIKAVASETPIEWSGERSSRTFSLAGIELKLHYSDIDEVRIGGVTCGVSRDIYWQDGFVDLIDPRLADAIAAEVQGSGYRAENSMSAMQAPDALVVVAELKGIEISVCPVGEGAYKSGSWVEVQWHISDPVGDLGDRVFRTEGSYDAGSKRAVKDGTRIAIQKSLAHAARNLLGNSEFVELLAPINAADIPYKDEPIRMAMSYGEGLGRFEEDVDALKDATVIIKTETGHGSGVVISPDGYVLTNAHVVGRHRNMLVKTGGNSYPATLIRKNPLRDVALLKISDYREGVSAPVSALEPNIGSRLYIIGTPLDEAFSQTITAGILSAKRETDGVSFYQTDAAINRGNSGGPVFSESGELVALTVSGYFTSDGASLNINYLIPIEDAINRLSIGPDGDLASVRALIGKVEKPALQAALHRFFDWLDRPVIAF